MFNVPLIIKLAGANAVAVTSSDERGEKCLELGAVGYINRKKFNCWGALPDIGNKEEYKEYLNKEMTKFFTQNIEYLQTKKE